MKTLDITDTAICIARELYELEVTNRVRWALIGHDVGYCQERQNIEELATAFDQGYEALPEEQRDWLDPWDMEMIPMLIHCAADWDAITPDNVTQALADWVALEQLNRAKRTAKSKENSDGK